MAGRAMVLYLDAFRHKKSQFHFISSYYLLVTCSDCKDGRKKVDDQVRDEEMRR